MPVLAPGAADVGIFMIPALRKPLQRQQRVVLGGRLVLRALAFTALACILLNFQDRYLLNMNNINKLRGIIFPSLMCFLIFETTSAFGEPIKLKCKPDGLTDFIADLSIDIEKGVLAFGSYPTPYKIVQQSNEYITAFEETNSSEVGGEIWVHNRITGRYLRAGVGIYCNSDGENCSMQTGTWEGICKRNLF